MLASLLFLCLFTEVGEDSFGGANVREIRTKSRELNALQKRIAQDRQRARFLRTEEDSMRQSLRLLDQAIANKVRSARQQLFRIESISEEMRALEFQVMSNRALIHDLRDDVAPRLIALKALGQGKYKQLLFGIPDRARRKRLEDRLRFVARYDADLLRSAGQTDSEYTSILKKLRGQKKALGRSRSELNAEMSRAQGLRSSRQGLLAAIARERRGSQHLVTELKAISEELKREFGLVRGRGFEVELGPGSFADHRGRLPWPVEGRVEATFGKKVDPGSFLVLPQDGLDIRSSLASPVRSVFSGTVAYAGRILGFGYVVVVSHEGGYFSTYAHLSRAIVEKGASVQPHQVVGMVGDIDSTKGAYLYFEIREGSTALDPMPWMASGV